MYHCTNCGAELEELYRRYCPRVLKLLKCNKCGLLADKYIEYDPAVILVDLLLIEKRAYAHLLYNSNLKSCWKLAIVIWLVESFRNFSLCGSDPRKDLGIERILNSIFEGRCNLYLILFRTAFSFAVFFLVVILLTEMKRFFSRERHNGYSVSNLSRALVIGGSGKLLGLLEIVWRHLSLGPHYVFIQGYTFLCLLAAYTVVCNSGKVGSSIRLAIGFAACNYVSNQLSAALEICEPI